MDAVWGRRDPWSRSTADIQAQADHWTSKVLLWTIGQLLLATIIYGLIHNG